MGWRSAASGLKVAAVSAAVCTGLLLLRPPFLEQLNVRLLDAKFRLRGSLTPSDAIALVVFDKESLARVSRWPWRREVIADLVREISRSGPRVIGVDVLFEGKTPGGGDGDDDLAAAIREAGNVVLSYFCHLDREEAAYQRQSEFEMALTSACGSRVGGVLQTGAATESSDVLVAFGLETNTPPIQRAARGSGFYNAIAGHDGCIRRVPLVVKSQDSYLCSFAVEVLRVMKGEPFTQLVLDGPRAVELRLGREEIPCDARGLYLVNYYGPRKIFPSYPAVKVLRREYPAGAFADKIVLIGGVAPGAFELRVSPFNPITASIEVQSSIIDNILTRRFLAQDTDGVATTVALLCVFTALMGGLVPLARRALVETLTVLAAAGGYLLADASLFVYGGRNVSTFYPLAAMLACYVVLTRLSAYRKEAYHRLQRATALELSGNLTKILRTDVLSPKILEAFMQVTGAQRGFLASAGDGPRASSELVIEAAQNLPGLDPGAEAFSGIRDVVQRSVGGKRMVFLPSAGRNTRLKGKGFGGAGSPGYLVCVPVLGKDRVQGVIYVDSAASAPTFGFDPEVLTAFANQAAIAMENAGLYTRLKEEEDKIRSENLYLMREVSASQRSTHIIGQSAALQSVLHLIEKAAASTITVLIEGETGTGKELIARCIHFGGPRKEGLLVAQNCGAIPGTLLESELFGHKKGAFTGAIQDKKGLFEIADGGSIFLDEVGDMPVDLQLKLLRVLESGEIRPVGGTRERQVDVRVISATNKNLAEEVKAGRFREDLFYRLNAFPITVPSLRERRDDIPLLVNHFITLFSAQMSKAVKGISREAMAALQAYDYPGNIRELKNEIEKAMVMTPEGEMIETGCLSIKFVRDHRDSLPPQLVPEQVPLPKALEIVQREWIIYALKKHDGNKTKAAEELGISRKGLHNLLGKYRLGGT